MSRIGLGIDAGGTFTKIFAVTDAGRIAASAEIATLPRSGPADYVRRLGSAVSDLERSLGRRARAVCMGVAGDVDPERGILRRSPNLESFEGFPLRKALSRALGRPVAVHNDANMAAWGCYAVELKRRLPNVVALTLGTGVGGGIILNGRLYVGSTGSAGEIGHMRVAPGGERCPCGARGCLEAYAGAAGIVRLRGKKGLDPKGIAAAARRGDRASRRAYQLMGRALGVGIVNLVYLFNPDAVVIVGGISRAWPLFSGEVRDALRAESFRTPFGRVRVRAAATAQLGSIGAALFALDGEPIS